MKDYIIWLKSGECITGTAEESVILQLQERFKDCVGGEKISFLDEDGKMVVALDRIEAIAINKQPEATKLGF